MIWVGAVHFGRFCIHHRKLVCIAPFAILYCERQGWFTAIHGKSTKNHP